MVKIVFVLIGKRKGKLSYLQVYSSRQKAEETKDIFETYDADNKDKNWKYEIIEKRVWD